MIFNRGFSLVEILIALVVVVVSGVGTLKAYSYIEITKANSALWMEALYIVNSQMTLMQRVNTSSPVTFENAESALLELDPESPFTLASEIEKTLDFSAEDGELSEVFVKVMNISVTWNDRLGEEQALNMPVTVTKISNLLD